MADITKINGARIRLAEGGQQKTVYVEHGIFYDTSTRNIHVAVGDRNRNGGIWNVKRGDKQFDVYRNILLQAGRWPEGADS